MSPRTRPWTAVVVAGLALVALLAGCLVAGGFIIELSTAKMGSRSKTFEAKSNLKTFYVAARAYHAEREACSESLEELGVDLPRGNRYRYIMAPRADALEPGKPAGTHGGVLADRTSPADNAHYEASVGSALLAEAGVHGVAPDCHLTVFAAGNIDTDPVIDVWSISTRERVIDGAVVAAGVPFRHVDDEQH